jgi:Ca-activated chloride channel family protein
LQKAFAVLCFLLIASTGHASPSSAFRDYQSGEFKGAFDEYNRLSQQNTNDYRLHYDAGAAAYRAKQLEKAEKQFNATLASPGVIPDVQTQEHTYYNLGNTEYHLGESLSEPDKKEALWQQAMDSYTNALRLNTNDADANNNLAYIKQQLEKLKQQQQQQQKQNKDKKNQKNDKDQQDQQNQQNQQNQQQKDQQDQQQQDSSKQDQQNGQDKQSAQDKKKEEGKKRQQDQAKKDQEKKEQQAQAKESEKKEQQQQEAQQAAAAGQMTPEEARQLLSEQKDEEKSLIFSPENQPVKTQPGKFKDW